MSGPVAQTIQLLEQELDALDQRRGEIEHIIDRLRPLAGDLDGLDEEVRRPAPRTAKTAKPPRSAGQDDDLQALGDRVVAALKKAGGSLKPGALAKAATVKLKSKAAYTRVLAKLAAAGRIARKGNGRAAVVTPPGRDL